MEKTKATFAANLIELRIRAGLTQAELAEKIHYSDKSISKWERAESLPDLVVAKELAAIFDVTVDYLITPHDAWEGKPVRLPYRTEMITSISMIGIWTIALLVFFILFWITEKAFWEVFLTAAPVSLITLLVLNSVWGKYKYHPFVVSVLLLAVFGILFYVLTMYVQLHHWWLLFFLWAPAQAIVILSFYIRKRKDKK